MKMKDFDITMTHYNTGDIITGTIVMIGEKEVTVAIGGLREGVFPREELDPAFKLGDAILVMVTGEIDEKGCIVMTHANVNKAIEDREKLKNLKVGSELNLSVNDISPASMFGGTWELLKSNVSLILGGKAPVIGNGNALGMYYGNGNTFQTRGITQSSGVYEPLRTSTELDGSQKVGDSCGLSAFAPNTFLGISIDEDKSGIITNLSNAENRIKSIYIWKRTA